MSDSRARHAGEALKKAVKRILLDRKDMSKNLHKAVRSVAGNFRIHLGQGSEDRLVERILWSVKRGGDTFSNFDFFFQGLPCSSSPEENVAEILMGGRDGNRFVMTEPDD